MITIRQWQNLNQNARNQLMVRGEALRPEIRTIVQQIVDRVERDGDDALYQLERELDDIDLVSVGLAVTQEEFDKAEKALAPPIKSAILHSIENVKKFHLKQMPSSQWVEEMQPGVRAGEVTRPIASVGLYVPRGTASFPSVMVMLGVPATVAGVREIVVASPPDGEGCVDPAVLFAATQLGITNVFRMGGAQAIAAMALGTETIPRVAKILGPGSIYVAQAKQVLAGRVDIGLQAGPSEAIVIADDTADAGRVALDLMNEAEHGPASSAFLVTPSADLAQKVAQLVEEYGQRLPFARWEVVDQVLERCGIILTPDISTAVDVANMYAVEHLVLHVARPYDLLADIEHAGEILIGPHTPVSAGNFLAGPNAVLPTAGFARSMSALSVRDFLHTSSVLELSAEGLSRLSSDVVAYAEYEGFPAHALAVSARPLEAEPSHVLPPPTSTQDLGLAWEEVGPQRIRVRRTTLESDIVVLLGRGKREPDLKQHIDTGLHFLNHMVETIAWRGRFNLHVRYTTPGYALMHVVAEDVGMTVGHAFARMIHESLSGGIEGSASTIGVIDEAQTLVALSVEGRPYLHLDFSSEVRRFERVEDMLSVDLENFLSGFCQGAMATLHVDIRRGQDPHHMWESVFRALGEAMHGCLQPNPYRAGTTPGVKGI